MRLRQARPGVLFRGCDLLGVGYSKGLFFVSANCREGSGDTICKYFVLDLVVILFLLGSY